MPRMIDVYSLLLHEPLAMRLEEIAAIRAAVLSGDSDFAVGRPAKAPKVTGAVAVIHIGGMIQKRAAWWMEEFGGTSTDQVGAVFASAMRNNAIGGVVFDVDSPGGTVAGTPELAAMIHASRGIKPVVSVANPGAASAAYWIGSAAEKMYAIPSGDVGSIGVWTAHEDVSKLEERIGVKTTLVSAGKYKVEGHPWGPLDDVAKAAMQSRVDEIYGEFVDAVAKHRGTSAAKVRNGFGEGRMVRAEAAVKDGMADGIKSLDEVIAEMTRGAKASGARASDVELQEELCDVWDGGVVIDEVDEVTEQRPQGVSVGLLRRKMELKRKVSGQ